MTYPIIAEFDVDPYYLLQAVAIFAAAGAPSCKRKDVLVLTVDQIRRGWDPVVEGLAEFLQTLRDDCGVILPNWLPYNTMLIPAAASLAASAKMKGPEVAAAKNKLKRWFWCSVFGQAYENSPNSQAAKDLGELKAWFAGGVPPETVREFSFAPDVLRLITPRQRAMYRGVIALILRHGARDLHTGDRINSSLMLEKKIDDHHVFPQAYLSERQPGVGNVLRDCVLNRTLIDKETNIRIGKRAPSDYLQAIEDSIGVGPLSLILESHLLPRETESCLRQDDFTSFIAVRQQAIAEQVVEATA
jgi:hypothetical protein